MNRVVSADERASRLYQLKKNGRGFLWSLFRMAILLGLAFVVLYPLINMLSVAFRDVQDLADPGVVWIPKHFTLENIRDAWKFMDYLQSFFNTLLLNVLPALIQTASCAIVGYGFARFQFKGKNVFFMLVLFTILVPQSVVYMPTYLMYRDFDPLGIDVYKRQMLEAARIDGASEYRICFGVVLPNVKPALLTVILFV